MLLPPVKNARKSSLPEAMLATPSARSRTSPGGNPAASRWAIAGLALLLVLATVLAYQPVWHACFIWDDDLYVTNNPLLTAPDGLKQIWFSMESPSQYFPLTYTTFRLERAAWGLNPAGYHWVNLLLHVANALLIWRLLRRLNAPGAWLAAAIFALHPVHVESVAWITELKNVQSLFFSLLTLLAWVEFVAEQSRQGWRFYALALICFALALGSKTTACTLPVALLLVLWLKEMPINRARWMQIVPFVLLGIGMGMLAMWWERHHQGTSGGIFAVGPLERVLIASRAVWFYTAKLVWPVDLTFSYPRWTIDAADPLAYAGLLAGVGAGAAIYFARRFVGRSVEVAAVFYVATLSPLLGFIMLYTFRYSFVADHYQYVASIGPIALASAVVARAAETVRIRAMVCAVAMIVLSALAVLTWRQAQSYRDPETLWRSTIAKNPDAWLAYDNLGVCLAAKGQMGEAKACYQASIRLNPNNASVQYNMGQALVAQGKFDEAIRYYTVALRLDANYYTHFGLGLALASSGRRDEGILHFRQAIKLKPEFAMGWYNLGLALCRNGQSTEGIGCLRQALQRDPGFADAVYSNANTLAAQNHFTEAIGWYEALLSAKPDVVEARVNLGNALAMTGKIEQAIDQYQTALRVKPDHLNAHNNLANLLAHQGRLDEAAAHYAEALRLDPLNAETHYNLGRVLVRQGQRAAAAAQFTEALRLDPAFARARQELEALNVER